MSGKLVSDWRVLDAQGNVLESGIAPVEVVEHAKTVAHIPATKHAGTLQVDPPRLLPDEVGAALVKNPDSK